MDSSIAVDGKIGVKTSYYKLNGTTMSHPTIMEEDDGVFWDLKCLQMETMIALAAQSKLWQVFVCVKRYFTNK